MSGLSLQVYDSPNQASMLADWTSRLSGELPVMNNEHGYGSLSGFVPMDIDEAFLFYNRDAMPHVLLTDGAFHVFEGRLEDTTVTSNGLTFTAFGYWRAYSDTLCTELWSDDSVTGWTWMKEQDLDIAGNRSNTSKYIWNNDDELYMAPRKGASILNTRYASIFSYSIPDKSTRKLVAISFDYDVDLLFGGQVFNLELVARNADTTFIAYLWNLSGLSFAGSASLTFATLYPCDVLSFEIKPNSAITYAGNTGDVYARISNIRVKTTDAATIDPSEIVTDLVASVATLNPSQVQSSTSLIESMGIDLTNEVYQDQRPQEIINKLISLGDDSTPPQLYEAAVWEDRYLALRPRGSAGREWAIDASDMSIKRTVDGLGNSVYAVYNSPSGKNLRTDTATDDTSVGAYDLTRQQFTASPSTTTSNPEAFRDALLQDSANPKPETSITFSRIADKFGALYELYYMRAGDTVLIRNLPPTAGDAVDRIRKFIIHRVSRYDPVSNSITIVPEKDAQSLPVLVAKNSENL